MDPQNGGTEISAFAAVGLSALCLMGFSTTSRAAAAQDVPGIARLSIAGPQETVYSYQKSRCDLHDIPDAPARAFRNNGGSIVLFASSAENYPFVVGAGGFVHLCKSAMASHYNPDPAQMDDRSFLASFWSAGKMVYALVHTEYHADLHARCAVKSSFQCWYNWVTSAYSTDGGASFHRPAGNFVVAAPETTQDQTQDRSIGYFNPTNIVRGRDGYYYTVVSMSRNGPDAGGACLLRSDTVADPSAWRAWNGESFGGRFTNPYRVAQSEQSQTTAPICIPLHGIRGTAMSLNRIKDSDILLLVSFSIVSDRKRPIGVVSYSQSRDFVNWSEPTSLLRLPPYNSSEPSDTDRYAYGSLIDLSTDDNNYGEIAHSTYLYMTRFHVGPGRSAMDRDLVRFPVALTLLP